MTLEAEGRDGFKVERRIRLRARHVSVRREDESPTGLDAEATQVLHHPFVRGARRDRAWDTCGVRSGEELRDTGPDPLRVQQGLRPQDHAVDDLHVQLTIHAPLQIRDGIEPLDRADSLRPGREFEFMAMGLVSLAPDGVLGRLGINDEPIEIEDEGADAFEGKRAHWSALWTHASSGVRAW